MVSFDLDRIQEQWPDFDKLTTARVRAFFRSCSAAHEPSREKALGLLLQPHDAELPGYYLRLARYLAESRIPIRELPPELLQVFLELIGSAGKIPGDGKLGRFFKACISKLPQKLLPWLFQQRFAAAPFLDQLGARMFPGGACCREFRGRWRVLKHRILQKGSLFPSTPFSNQLDALAITLADLGPILSPKRATLISNSGRLRPFRHTPNHPGHRGMWGRLSSLPGGLPASPPKVGNPAWRSTARHLSAPPSLASSRFSPTFSGLYWGGGGKRRISFLERLARAQAEENTEIGRLAERMSAVTGSVVLSWHNASLASAGGWTFEEFSSRFSSPAVYRDFAESVFKTADEIRMNIDETMVCRLTEMRIKRIFLPRAAQELRHIRALRNFDAASEADWLEKSRQAAALLSPEAIDEIASARKSEWTGPLAPHQRAGLDRVIAWADETRNHWVNGLCLMLALAARGREALDTGLVPSFVLPWIDKFFISSRRRADQGYLESLFRLVTGSIKDPLILFWEDTAHARLPSFGLALEELAGRGLPFGGIGVFDPVGSSRRDAAEMIRRGYPEKLLFALRPLNDDHHPELSRIFDEYEHDFGSSYDSSWKDNLVFLYSGTLAFQLLSPQTEMELVSPWVSDGRHRCPFGAWFRHWLRNEATGKVDSRDPLWRTYSTWANLL